eukprot:CAMPEP_0172584288 /NCGR_PEP_ID=MMETSP1068-20121228/3877_1 /TAXON_ID=35684 /ORGANISM="Pseudopedinella elastica, Strain CCMP716" /LENGTH=226 /DNA_ID=CAMNT_0013378413 /DNA_START=157 /DNA_END=837 /DNA_ORIENTATION=+
MKSTLCLLAAASLLGLQLASGFQPCILRSCHLGTCRHTAASRKGRPFFATVDGADSSSKAQVADGADSAETAAPDPKMSLEEIEALPTLDELLESGEARREVFRGEEVSDRFHIATRALNGEFSHSAPEEDTEAGGEGAITAAILKFPGPVSFTAVGKLAANEDFVSEIARCVEVQAGAKMLKVSTKPRSGGKFVSVQVDYAAESGSIPPAVLGSVRRIAGVKMVF